MISYKRPWKMWFQNDVIWFAIIILSRFFIDSYTWKIIVFYSIYYWGFMLKISQICSTIVLGSAIAPFPLSLHMSTFSMQGISMYPQDFIQSTWGWVTGWSHMHVFMAGAKRHGLLKSQALATQVSRLSESPWLIFANELALRGAIMKTSAHLLSSMSES